MDLDEGELFMELIRDVANELDIDVLCHKILVNVGLLTHADRGSLFLAKGTPNNRYLVAKLFDVTQKTGEQANVNVNVVHCRFRFAAIVQYVAQQRHKANSKHTQGQPQRVQLNHLSIFLLTFLEMFLNVNYRII